MQNDTLEQKLSAQESDLAPFIGNRTKDKKSSEIKPPLVRGWNQIENILQDKANSYSKPIFYDFTSKNMKYLKVRQSRIVFFKPMFLPKNEQTNSFSLPNSTMIEWFRSFFWKNSRIAKSPVEIN